MIVNTLHFGKLEIVKDDIFTFSQGIPGFESLRQFVIIQPDTEVPFSYLQSVEQGEVSIIITNPFLFYPDYELQLNDKTQEELHIKQEKDVLVWSTVSVIERIQEATINLLAPIVVNVEKKLGKQVILHGSSYITKHRLIREGKTEEEG
jgi:flagellar assembly factor FliW